MAVEHGISGDRLSTMGAVAADPVVQAIFSIVAVSTAVMFDEGVAGLDPAPILAPIYDPWYGAVLSIFAHTDPKLLVANATVVAIAGTIVAMSTSRPRFQMFFVTSGTASAIIHVQITGLVGPSLGGIGASGAAIALVGYMFTGIIRPKGLIRRRSVLPVLGIIIGLGLVAMLLLSKPDGTYIAHATGATIGIIAGHYNVLRKSI